MHPLQHVVESKLLRIIRVFLSSDELFQLQTVSVRAKVALGTAHRLLPMLVRAGLVEVIVVGKTRLYRTNKRVKKKFGVLK